MEELPFDMNEENSGCALGLIKIERHCVENCYLSNYKNAFGELGFRLTILKRKSTEVFDVLCANFYGFYLSKDTKIFKHSYKNYMLLVIVFKC